MPSQAVGVGSHGVRSLSVAEPCSVPAAMHNSVSSWRTTDANVALESGPGKGRESEAAALTTRQLLALRAVGANDIQAGSAVGRRANAGGAARSRLLLSWCALRILNDRGPHLAKRGHESHSRHGNAWVIPL